MSISRAAQLEIIESAFAQMSLREGNPGDIGISPRQFAVKVARMIRAANPYPHGSEKWKAGMDVADALERGDFDRELATMFGYV